jgi:hypothetical protein
MHGMNINKTRQSNPAIDNRYPELTKENFSGGNKVKIHQKKFSVTKICGTMQRGKLRADIS